MKTPISKGDSVVIMPMKFIKKSLDADGRYKTRVWFGKDVRRSFKPYIGQILDVVEVHQSYSTARLSLDGAVISEFSVPTDFLIKIRN